MLLVKLPIGQFFFHRRNWSVLGQYYDRFSYPLYWKLNSKLKLNLTFFNIQFFSGMPDGQLDSLTVFQGRYFCRNTDKTLRDKYEQFCGHHSTFSFYPNSTEVTVCLKDTDSHIITKYQVHGMYMILDENIITSIDIDLFTISTRQPTETNKP